MFTVVANRTLTVAKASPNSQSDITGTSLSDRKTFCFRRLLTKKKAQKKRPFGRVLVSIMFCCVGGGGSDM